MKRGTSRVASAPGLFPARGEEASSGPGPRAVTDVASCLSGVGGSLGRSTQEPDPGLVADFVDFLEAGRESSPGTTRSPNPEFTEQLRRRLWRMHLLARRTDRDATH